MRKIIAIIVIILVCLFLIMLREIFAGGVSVDFEVPKQSTAYQFAQEFKSEVRQREEIIFQFSGTYLIKGYLGNAEDKKIGRKGSAIGIFVNDEELRNPADCIWMEDLFSEESIKEEAKESAGRIFKHLKKLEIEKKIKSGGKEI